MRIGKAGTKSMQDICATAMAVEKSKRRLIMPRFAIPFEEDERDPKTFFLDLDYVEEMWRMFRKVNGMSPLSVVACNQSSCGLTREYPDPREGPSGLALHKH